MPDGREPVPGGWNRIHLQVDNLDAEVKRLREAGLKFRNDIVTGPGGSQILLDDPSGNPVELFQPKSSIETFAAWELKFFPIKHCRFGQTLKATNPANASVEHKTVTQISPGAASHPIKSLSRETRHQSTV